MKKAIKRVLRKAGWELKRVPKGMEDGCFSCTNIENATFIVGHPSQIITMCCEQLEGTPYVPLADTPEETLERFVGLRHLLLQEGKSGGKRFSSGCRKCAKYYKDCWSGGDGFVHSVSLSLYPSPCQCRCIYCTVLSSGIGGIEKDEDRAAYEKFFAAVELAVQIGLIAPDAVWDVACGEITIHPYKERILRLVHGKNATFFSNCFKYDELIAEHLQDNPNSRIFLSIDSGTPETWHKIKGFDNFEQVLSNLRKYRKKTAKGQISLKYIMLPGVNDNEKDYLALMKIMKELDVVQLTITRDERIKYAIGEEAHVQLMAAAAHLAAVCQRHKILPDVSYDYSPQERKQIAKSAEKILKGG